jgi:hypothetical protein
MARRLLWAGSALVLTACASSSVTLTGTARPPISPDEVRVYTARPSSFEEVALLRASRKSVGANGEKAIEKVIDEMKSAAAKLGANGLLLEDFSDSQSLTVGTGVGSDTYTHNGSISLGVGGDIGIIKRTGTGRAIFIKVK